MRINFNIRAYKFVLMINKTAHVIGVDSYVGEGEHIIMWDFDGKSLSEVCSALKAVQSKYGLSDIHVIRTKEPNNYHGFCFSKMSWQESVLVVADTEGVDWQFFRFGVYRGHWTLRITPKTGILSYRIAQLFSHVEADCKPPDLKHWVKYETLNWR